MGEHDLSEQHSVTITAHHNIYTKTSGRELRIDFSTPQNGVNENTGLLIVVPGFGGNIESKVYKKMRGEFADQFNLVTIQCDYFGSAHMQSADNFTVSDPKVLHDIFTDDELEQVRRNSSLLPTILSKKKTVLPVKAEIKESMEDFNDMGYMQAVDIITAIEVVKIILRDNEFSFNENRVIGYGHSHGAYLLHLGNRLAPHLFSYIIDNSAWIEPVYVQENRMLYQKLGESTLAIKFDYLVKTAIGRRLELNLEKLYQNFNGRAQILSFQGDQDHLINHVEKERIVSKVNNADFILITKDDVDQIKYKSNGHGLNADFLELFSFAISRERAPLTREEEKMIYRVNLEGVQIEVDSTQGLPLFTFNF